MHTQKVTFEFGDRAYAVTVLDDLADLRLSERQAEVLHWLSDVVVVDDTARGLVVIDQRNPMHMPVLLNAEGRFKNAVDFYADLLNE